jgi:molybdopterin-guanine dinucleotide biosynthesis protein B
MKFRKFPVPVFGVTGWKNSGKTLLTTRLIDHFTKMGLRVGAIKHAHHSFEIDHEGRDSWKMRQAGARQVAVVSQFRWALLSELDPEPEPDFEQVLAHFKGFDLVLVEGYKHLAFPKIEVRSSFQKTRQKLAGERDDVIALASMNEADREAGLPFFSSGEIAPMADFILDTLYFDDRHGEK